MGLRSPPTKTAIEQEVSLEFSCSASSKDPAACSARGCPAHTLWGARCLTETGSLWPWSRDLFVGEWKNCQNRVLGDPSGFSGHSLRRSVMTELTRRQISVPEMMSHARWRTASMCNVYSEELLSAGMTRRADLIMGSEASH